MLITFCMLSCRLCRRLPHISIQLWTGSGRLRYFYVVAVYILCIVCVLCLTCMQHIYICTSADEQSNDTSVCMRHWHTPTPVAKCFVFKTIGTTQGCRPNNRHIRTVQVEAYAIHSVLPPHGVTDNCYKCSGIHVHLIMFSVLNHEWINLWLAVVTRNVEYQTGYSDLGKRWN
jgi:hypothetical protein